MKKSTKRLTISSESVNSNGFRVRTSGIELAEFNANPLLLWMHKRPQGQKDELLPLGYWTDIELKDGKITGVPVFDDSDDFALKIYNKVENGTIKMASAGLKPLEFSDTTGDKWLEKSILKEASIVDIGSNKDCVAVALYGDQYELVTLSEAYDKYINNSKNDNSMKTIQLSADTTLPLLKLNESATAADTHAAILKLVTLSETQNSEIEQLKTKNKTLEDKLNLAEKADGKKKCVELAEGAVKERKITEDQKEFIIALAESDYENAEKYVKSLKGAPEVTTAISNSNASTAGLEKLSWDELDKNNQLVTLKEGNIDLFKEKYKAKFNKEWNS